MKPIFVIIIVILSFNLLNALSGWVVRPSYHNEIIRSVSNADVNNWYICGDGGRVMRSYDAGWSWIQQVHGVTYWLSCISYNNVNSATAVGYPSTIIKTNNSGTSWFNQYGGQNIPLY